MAETIAGSAKVKGYDLSEKIAWVINAPLVWAAENRHEGVVKVLLARDDIGSNKPENEGPTLLWRPARKEHQGVLSRCGNRCFFWLRYVAQVHDKQYIPAYLPAYSIPVRNEPFDHFRYSTVI